MAEKCSNENLMIIFGEEKMKMREDKRMVKLDFFLLKTFFFCIH